VRRALRHGWQCVDYRYLDHVTYAVLALERRGRRYHLVINTATLTIFCL
jgi:hypothetical protein